MTTKGSDKKNVPLPSSLSATLTGNLSKSPHREGSKPFDLGRHTIKTEAVCRKQGKVAQVLNNRYSGQKEGRLNRTDAGTAIINIIRIDAHQFYFILHQEFGCRISQERMVLEILFCLPVNIPAGIDQYRFPLQFKSLKDGFINGQGIAGRSLNKDTVNTGKGSECDFRKIRSIRIPVEGYIDGSAGIGGNFNYSNMKSRTIFVVFF